MSDAGVPPTPGHSHLGDGGLPEHLLDPSIARLANVPRGAFTASPAGTLTQATDRFFARYHHRYLGPINSMANGGEIPRHHEKFPFDELLDAIELDMIDEELLDALESFQVILKEPGEVDFDLKIWEALQQKCPQFFLRNVTRAEKETNLPHVPFEVHVFREPDEYEFEQTQIFDLELASTDMIDQWTYETVGEQRRLMHSLTRDFEWANYNDWQEGRAELLYQELFEVKRKKGKFATEAERRAERKAERDAKLGMFKMLSKEARARLGLED